MGSAVVNGARDVSHAAGAAVLSGGGDDCQLVLDVPGFPVEGFFRTGWKFAGIWGPQCGFRGIGEDARAVSPRVASASPMPQRTRSANRPPTARRCAGR